VRLATCVATAVVAIALVLASPVRAISGDTVPGRIGAVLVRCGGGFDLRRIGWMDAERRPYWAAQTADGAWVSVYGPTPALAGAVMLLDLHDGDALADDVLRVRERCAAALCLGVAVGLLALAARARRSAGASAAIGLVAAGSFAGAATLGQGLWQQTIVLPFVVGAIATLAWRGRALVATPALLALALVIRSAIAPLAVAGAVAWWPLAAGRRPLAIALAALAIGPLVAWNLAHLGSPISLAQWQANARYGTHVLGLAPGRVGYALGGLLIGPARGLSWFAPIAILGVVAGLARGDRTQRVLAVGAVAQLAAVACFHMWWGGICFGPRFLAEAVWLGIWLAFAVEHPWRRLVRVAVAITLAVGLLGLFRWRAEQWETRRNPDIDQNALWDFMDSPIVALFGTVDDQPLALDAPDEPPRMRCVEHRVLRDSPGAAAPGLQR
jgi:hypothetical protein